MSNSYYRGVDLSFTPLTPEDEQRLCKEINAGSSTARETLIRNHLRWATTMARRYRGRLPLEDAISAANEGLMLALASKVGWQASKGRFSSYAFNFVRGNIFQAIAHLSVVPTNVHLMCQRSEIRKARAGGECPVETLGLSPVRIEEIERAWDCERTEPGHMEDTAGEMGEGLDGRSAVGALGCLSERAQHIMKYRYGIVPMPDGGVPSLAALGTLFGISRERVRQIEHSSLATLRTQLECETSASE